MQKNLLTFSKSPKAIFIDEGSGNWKDALQRLQEHEKSMTHKEATKKIAQSSSTPIVARLNMECADSKTFIGRSCLKVMSCIIFQARQVIPLHGCRQVLFSLGGAEIFYMPIKLYHFNYYLSLCNIAWPSTLSPKISRYYL